MALQDLTPQLRTRLSRMERAVGWFVLLATFALVFGFSYYVYTTAERKGWFKTKIYYETCITSGAGLKEGDPVKLMGFDVGEITSIIPNDPYAPYNITVEFRIIKPNFGYIWSDSKARIVSGDLLGHRYLEVVKGIEGVPTVHETHDKADGVLRRDYFAKRKEALSQQFTNQSDLLRELNRESRAPETSALFYTNALDRETAYWLEPEETPAITERVEKVVNQVEAALPGILSLTNQLAAVLSNSTRLTANLDIVATDSRPAVSNLAFLTARLNHPGALGDWLLPTNTRAQLDSVLGNADAAMTTANTNLVNLNRSLLNLADLTSNLNAQVQFNSNILGQISQAIVDADDFVQGLKHHWLLRSAFKTKKTNAPAPPLPSPKERGSS